MTERWRSKAGFTLFELLLVLAIVSVAMAVVLPSISAGLGSLSARSATLEISSALTAAREKAVRERMVYRADITDSALVISSADGKRTEYAVADGLSLDSAQAILFSPNGFSSGGDITLSSRSGSYIVRVLPTGRTRTEAK